MKYKFLPPIVVAILAALFASRYPDGLAKTSELLDFAGKGLNHRALLAGYHLPFIKESGFSAIFAGISGVFLVYGFFLGIRLFLRKANII